MTPEELMQLAVQIAHEGLAKDQSPFGCAIARDGEILSVAHNTVASSVDITAHAEINALRQACATADSIHLQGAVVATTCEPCPMCMAALHWARVDTVHFGASIDDAARAGFNELTLPAMHLLKAGGSEVKLIGYVLREECRKLFDHWLENPNRTHY